MTFMEGTSQIESVNAGGSKALNRLHRAVDEAVGSVFYGTLLKTMRTSPLKGAIGHGGRGEEAFRGQLDQELVQRAGRARRYSLNESLVARFAPSAAAHEQAQQK